MYDDDILLANICQPMTSNQPTEPQIQIEKTRNQIVNFILAVGSITGVVMLFMEAFTIFDTGWTRYFYGLISIVLLWTVMVIFRNKVRYQVRASTVVFTFYVIGVLNLLGWGLIGAAGIWFVMTLLLAIALLTRLFGLIIYLAIVITYSLVTLLVRLDLLTFTIDFETYAINNTAWLSRTFLVVVITATSIVSLELLFNLLRDQVKQFAQRSEELTERTAELSNEVIKRQQAEESLESAVARLKDLDKLKDDFIDSVSHELRTPLANIKLYHQLLAMRPENSEQYLQILGEETERLNQIVEQMLYLSSESSDIELSTMLDIDIKTIFLKIFVQNEPLMKKRDVTVSTPAITTEYVVLAAPKHIERIVMSLVDNAIKYTPNGGHIKMECVSDVSGNVPMVGVIISNTSDSLTEDEQEKLFERFVRGTTSLNLGVPGAGLGLPTARELARRYGGYLLSSYDDDTQMLAFTLWLPGKAIEPSKIREEETQPSLKTPTHPAS